MPGKHQRTEHVDFLGNEYMLVRCPKCGIVYEAMSIDKGAQLCGPCANPEEEDDKG